jgi:tetratricopeptide (TPR) repeat protein
VDLLSKSPEQDQLEARIRLADALWERYELSGDLTDLQEYIRLYNAVLHALPSANANRAQYTNHLATAHRHLFGILGYEDDLLTNIRLLREVVLLSECTTSGLSKACHALGTSIFQKYLRSEDLSDLHEVIEILKRAFHCCHSHVARDELITDLGDALTVRSHIINNFISINEAIAFYENASTYRLTPHPNRHYLVHNLGELYLQKYFLDGDSSGLSRAILCLEEAVQLRPPGFPGRDISLGNLGNALRSQFQRTGDLALLRRAIQLHQETLQLPLFKQFALDNVGIAMIDGFHLTGDMSFLDDAIRSFQTSLDLTSRRPHRRDIALISASNALLERYDVTGDLSSLKRAISFSKEALVLRPQKDTPDRHRDNILITLGFCMLSEYQHLRSPSHLQEAQRFFEEARDMRLKGHPERANALRCCGNVLVLQYDTSQDVKLLDQAIELYRESLDLTPRGDPDRFHSLTKLGQGLRARCRRNGGIDDAEEAVEHAHEQLELQVTGHPHHYIASYDASLAYLLKPTLNVDLAITHLLDAVVTTHDHGNARQRLRLAKEGIHVIDSLFTGADFEAGLPTSSTYQSLLEVYVSAINLLPRVAFFGLDIDTRLRELENSETMVSRAALLALDLGQPERSLELLELGRAVFWTQALRLRTTYTNLPQSLSDEMRALSKALEQGSYKDHNPPPLDSAEKHVLLDEVLVRRRKQSRRFETLVQETRTLPGLERFMLGNSYAELASAAKSGPVVVLLEDERTCRAIILCPGSHVTSVVLTEAKAQRLRQMGRAVYEDNLTHRGSEAEEDDHLRGPHIAKSSAQKTSVILSELWRHTVKPVVQRLQLQVRIVLPP